VLRFPNAAVELAQAEVAVGDEGAHAVQLGDCQSLPIVSSAAFGIEPVGMARDVAAQVQGMGRAAGLALGGFNRAIAQALRLVESSEQ
jgi:hypothetical protein